MKVPSAMPCLEILHESNQFFNSGQRHGIVYRSSHPTHRPVPLQLHHLLLRRLLDELRLQFRLLQRERHIHQRPHRLLHRAPVKPIAPVYGFIKNLRLLNVLLLHRRQTALRQEILEHQSAHVDPETRRCVVERVVIGVDLVIQHHRSGGLGVSNQVFSYNHDGDAGWADVFLGAGVDRAEFGNIHRFRTEIRGHIGDKKGVFVRGCRIILEFHAVDCFVGTNMQIPGVWILFQRIEVRNLGVLAGFPRPNHRRTTVFSGFLESLVPPRPGHNVIDGIVRFAEIQGQSGELGGCAALDSVSSRFISFRLPHSLLSHCQFFLHFHSPSRPNRAFSANPNSFPRHESAISKSESNFPSSSIHKPSISANSLDFDLITVLETLACYANDWKRALEFFNWVETDCGFDHCTETYNRVIDILGKFFEFDIAWDLIDKMRKFEDSVPDHITFRIMFKRYISAHLVAEAISVYERMEQFNLKDEISFSNLIDALCEYKHVIEAAELCFGNDKNLNKGLCVDVKSTKIHNMILRGWFKLGWWSKCGEFWEEMDRRGVHKDLHSYSIYMDILCKRGKPWKAVKLYKEMKNKGIKLDVVAYNTVIRAIGFTDGVDMAIRLHREMMELGIRPNVATYNIILKLLCDNWRPKDAYKLLDQMSKRGCEPNVITYHCFFGSLEKPKEILKLFNRMIDSGIRPKMDTYVMLMRKFGRWGFLRPVFFVWKKMEEHGLSPDGFAYNALIDALLQKGMVDMAKKYDEEMMVKGLSPKPRVVLGTQRVPEGG